MNRSNFLQDKKPIMPLAKEFDKQVRVSNLVKLYEEMIQPFPKKVTLVRDVRKRNTGLEFCKKFKDIYLQKFERAKYTTWHVRSSIFLKDCDKSNDSGNNIYATNSTPAVSSNQSGEDENIGCRNYICSNEIILKKQCELAQNDPTTNGYNKKSKNGLNNKDLNDSNCDSTIMVDVNNIMDDDSEIILRHEFNSKEKIQCANDKNEKLEHGFKNKYFQHKAKLNLDTATGDVEDCIPNETKIGFIKQHLDVANFNDVKENLDSSVNMSDKDISKQDSNLSKDLFATNSERSSASSVSKINYSDTADTVRLRNKELVNEEIQTSSSVVSWIKDSQFSDNLENAISKCDQSSQTEHKLQTNEQNKSILMEVKDPENNGNEGLMDGYEDIEIYRQNVLKEINLIENIKILDDDDDGAATDNAEDHYQEIPEIQYVNRAESLMQCTSRNVDEHNKLMYYSNNNYFNIDEVDISNKGIFGKGRCRIKIRTSYLEVINPLRNKKAPDQFFNEVYFLTSIPIDIAKYINKNKYNSRFDGSVNDDLEFHVDTKKEFRSSLDRGTTFRPRCESTQSVATVDSDDFLQHIIDYNSSTEDVQPNTSGLIRTDSKLIRVDQTYYNNTLRITRNVVVEESTRVKPKSEYILDELLTTEFNNLSILEYVRDYYMPEIQKIADLFLRNAEFKCSDIFLNWHSIYREACNFYERIEACGYNYQQLAEEILMSRNLFEEYSNYCKNKAQAERHLQGDIEAIVEIVQERLGDKLGLSSHLVQPIQRLTKYKLLLEALKKELIESGECYSTLNNAIDMIERITSESNDCIDASYIKDLPFKLGDQGKIIRKDTFNVVKVKPKAKWMDMKIFLYENVLIITAPIKFLDGYIYKDHIFMEHMKYHSCDITKKFIISDYMQNKKANDKNYRKFICTHKSEDVATEWENLIMGNLMKQFCILKDLASSNMVKR